MAGKEYDVRDDEQVGTLLTNFMTWASLTRDIEMQKGECYCLGLQITSTSLVSFTHCGNTVYYQIVEGQELCAASSNTMPWDLCTVSQNFYNSPRIAISVELTVWNVITAP